MVILRYLDFLRIPSDHPRRQRKGVYSSHIFESPTGNKVKVILLDTRYSRGSYYIPSIAFLKIPFSAFIACFTRLFCSYFRLYSDDEILGEAQWKWFEEQILDSGTHIL